MKLFKKLYS